MSNLTETLNIRSIEAVPLGYARTNYLVRIEADNGSTTVSWTCSVDEMPDIRRPITLLVEWTDQE